MILLDTSGVLAWIDGGQRLHAEVAAAMRRVEPPYLLSPFVLAELDYLLATRVGNREQLALLAEVEQGAFQLEPFFAADISASRQVMEECEDLRIGLADASLVVLAERHRVYDVLTLDERHFRTLRAPKGQRFRLLPADAQRRR